ncbi:DUF58 domain-containing protein [Candidatus Aalborgicola defluviihabitans]|jgi:uncharacterized protein (DUF58 family)|uniref:DUF58 domain-containing protein n=1 Tax=Candidatus Aalborgicola defluviihabitans TaxID=3386187 RepID=UPI001D73FBB7|nr:DUF58 domain-containing protein [Burkholderiales bacterium]MBK7313290.1 DUF58 domain-containing protein [Burkholderiales bacterium]MBL0244565.1 DUF58 domain-containing protein [Rhodoferax sp.]
MKLPDLSDLVLLRVAARGLSLNAHHSAMAQLYGGHRSAQRGRGLEFEEVRPYVPGDDARTIDWRVTARRGKPHTKLFREERERPVWIVADLHSGLFFGSKRQFKSAVLLQAAALLAWVAALGGDRVGAIIVDGSAAPHILPPRGREAGVLPILQALIEGQPRAPDAPVQTGLQTALTTLRPLLQPGSLVLLLSDFAQVDPPLQDMLAGIARQNDCRLLWLTDPLERNGLPAGEHRVGLPQRLWWVNGEASRDAWQAAWTERQARLTAMAEALNLPLVRLDTADALSDNLVALIKEPRWAL